MDRNKEIDFIKGFLIVMVILGHTTASFGIYEKNDILNYLNGFTVSYIMPFFLIITGYLIKTPERNINILWFRRKFRRLIIPALIWGGSVGVVALLYKALWLKESIFNFESLKQFLNSCRYLWYLYATFIGALIIGIVNRVVKHSSLGNMTLIIIAILLHLIPTDAFWASYAFEFILLGYLIRQNKINVKMIWEKYAILISGAYLILLLFFKYDYSVYVAGSSLIKSDSLLSQLGVNGFRYLMGVMGAIFIGGILDFFYNYFLPKSKSIEFIKESIVTIGNYSLEMYVTQFVVVEKIFTEFMVMFPKLQLLIVSNSYLCYFIWRHVFGICLTIITFLVCRNIKRTIIGKYVY